MIHKTHYALAARLWLQLLLIFALASIFNIAFLSQSSLAHEQEGHSQESSSAQEQIDGYVPRVYEYVVKPGNSQTLLVRRSLQLYDLANGSLNLTPAQLVYAETNVVNELGRMDLIYPEQMLGVMSELVAKYAKSSQNLNDAELAGWQVYANQARLDIDFVQARNVSLDDGGKVVPTTDLGPDLEFSTSEDLQTSQPESNSWHVWLITAGSIALLTYAFWRVQDPQID